MQTSLLINKADNMAKQAKKKEQERVATKLPDHVQAALRGKTNVSSPLTDGMVSYG